MAGEGAPKSNMRTTDMHIALMFDIMPSRAADTLDIHKIYHRNLIPVVLHEKQIRPGAQHISYTPFDFSVCMVLQIPDASTSTRHMNYVTTNPHTHLRTTTTVHSNRSC